MAELRILWQERKRLTFFALPWTFTVYKLSEDRLFIERGFLNKHYDETRLYRVFSVSLEESLIQRVFGLGTITVRGTDRELGDFKIRNIPNAKYIKEQLSQLVEYQRAVNNVHSTDFISGIGG